MIWDPISRRMFLGRMGKFVLATPLLPSVLPKKAWGAEPVIPPRFIFISSVNGAAQNQHWFPAAEPTATKTSLYPAKTGNPYVTSSYYDVPEHFMHHGPIRYDAVNGISPLFDSKFNKFVPMMNFVRGLDIRAESFGNHYGSPLLGNFKAANEGSNSFMNHWPTIDQIMAYSSSFYPNGGAGFVRSVYINSEKNARNQSFNWENPINRTGNVISQPHEYDAKKLFEKFFVAGQAVDPDDPKSTTPIVDTILNDYKKVRNGRAISSDDKVKLDGHIALLAQLEQDLKSKGQVSASCKDLQGPPSTKQSSEVSNAQHVLNYKLYNDVMVAALRCDRTRVMSHFVQYADGYGEGGSTSEGSWHWASHVASGNAQGADILLKLYKWVGNNVLFDLIDKMDSVVESNGKSLLENSLLHYSTATQHNAHSNWSVPCVTFGSALGKIKTGQYIDYRNRDSISKGGLLYNRWLVTVMQAMGLSSADYDMTALGLTRGAYPNGSPGYGEYKFYDLLGYQKFYNYHEHQQPDVGKPLPELYKG